MRLADKIALAITTFLLISIVEAHQPRIVFDGINSKDNPAIITEPEISRAYYGELKGKQDYYMIISEKPFTLYLNILKPYKLGDNKNDFFVEARDYTNRQVMLLDGTDYEWKLFHEPFGNDDYMQGPEGRVNLKEGMYYINVSSGDNTGKYSLAVGEKESFPIDEIFKTFYTIPKIKTKFFGKPFLSSFYNLVGVAMLIILIIIISIIAIIVKIFKKKKRIINPPKRLTH